MHRIFKAEVGAEEFHRLKYFHQDWYDDGHFGFGEVERIKLVFLVDRNAGLHLLKTPLSINPQVVELGDVLKINATVVKSAQPTGLIQ